MPTTQTLIDGTTRQSYSTKETAQLIREALKQAFPGVKFSVRTEYASMTSATRIQWTDGPTQPEAVHQFAYSMRPNGVRVTLKGGC